MLLIPNLSTLKQQACRILSANVRASHQGSHLPALAWPLGSLRHLQVSNLQHRPRPRALVDSRHFRSAPVFTQVRDQHLPLHLQVCILHYPWSHLTRLFRLPSRSTHRHIFKGQNILHRVEHIHGRHPVKESRLAQHHVLQLSAEMSPQPVQVHLSSSQPWYHSQLVTNIPT